MTRIFLSYALENTTCAEALRTELEAQGYTAWREPTYPNSTSASYLHMIETAVLGSAAVVFIWSQYATQATWVARHLLFAQGLKKPIFPIVLDGTNLPNTLVSASPPLIQADCTDAVRALLALSSFPPAHSTDAFITLSEQAAHEFIRERKAAIKQAADLIARGEHHEEVLAMLAYLAKNDTIMGVREEAQKVLDAQIPQATTTSQPAFRPQNAQYIFGVHCKNGHVSYFDKRVVCSAHTSFLRLVDPTGKALDELHLTCDTCKVEIVAHVDCEGY